MDGGNTLEWGDARLVPSVEDEPTAHRGVLELRLLVVDPSGAGRRVVRRIRLRMACRLEAGRLRRRAAANDASARVEFDGFGRPATFIGEIDVADGTLRLEGALDGVPLRLRLAFDESTFRSEDHLFESLEEAAEVAPERVRFLKVVRLDERVLDFVCLRELEIVSSSPGEGIGNVPGSLAALGALRTLVIRGGPSGRPGALSSESEAESPTVPGLDALLGHVPELASLSELAVLGCLVPSLPENFAATRLRVLTHPADRAPLLARSDPVLARGLRDAVDAFPALAPARDAILALARRSVFLTPTALEDYAELGTTRFGGRPDLPPDVTHSRATEEKGKYRTVSLHGFRRISYLRHVEPRRISRLDAARK